MKAKSFIFVSLILAVFIFSLAFVIAQNETNSDSSQLAVNESEKTLDVNPGMTPDNPLYFIKDIYERITVGSNPETALAYKEEKIAEARAMIDEGKTDEANRVLDRAMQYGDIVERETNPDITDKVQESSEVVTNTLENLAETITDSDLKEKINETISNEQQISTAAELAAKISELCDTLAKINPLQYADSCKPKTNSPKWVKEQDNQLTKEQEQQAQVFFDKLSKCFEDPGKCDCKGIRVQKFEDFCLQQSALAVKCMDGDTQSCQEVSNQAPEDLLPSYLIPVMKKVEEKYSNAQFNNFAPEECEKAGAKTAADCNKIMFQRSAPRACIDAGLTGASREDDYKCKQIMYRQNTPQECIDAGISTSDADAPRKCAKIMFQLRAPQACLDVGITGEGKEDEVKCKQLMQGQMIGKEYKPIFNKDCNSVSDINEKMKCYEEFYNNAQVQIKDDFRNNTQSRVICQSQQQTETLRQDCLSRGQEVRIEYKAGCPWVICINKLEQNMTQQTGIKCPDGICDSYEKMNPYACPDDCGGVKTSYYNQTILGCQDSPPSCGLGNYFVCQNGAWICISSATKSCSGSSYQCTSGAYSICQDGAWTCNPATMMPCSGSSYACGNGGYSYCQNGNWVCPPSTTCTGTPQSCSNGVAYCNNGNWVCPPSTMTSCFGIPINCPMGASYCKDGNWVCPSTIACSGTSYACGNGGYSVCENGAWVCRQLTRVCSITQPNCPIGKAYCSDGNWICPSQSPNCPGMSPPCSSGGSYCNNGAWVCPITTTCSGTPINCGSGSSSVCQSGNWVCQPSSSITACSGTPMTCSGGSFSVCQNGVWVCQPSTGCSGVPPSCPNGGAICQNNAWICPTATTTCSGIQPTCSNGLASCQNGAWTCNPITSTTCATSAPSCPNGSPTCQSGNWVCPSTSPNCPGYSYSCGSSGMAVCQNGAWTCPSTTASGIWCLNAQCMQGQMCCGSGSNMWCAWSCPSQTPSTCSGSSYSCGSSGMAVCQNGAWTCAATTPTTPSTCSGSSYSCGSGTYSYCNNGMWICPPSTSTTPPATGCQCPCGWSSTCNCAAMCPSQTPPPTSEPGPGASYPPGDSQQSTPPAGTENPPATGSAITGNIIVSDYGNNENSRSGEAFLNYWFGR
jgi:hypothetical protein